ARDSGPAGPTPAATHSRPARTAQPVTLTGPAAHTPAAAGNGAAAGTQTARDSGPAGPTPAATHSRPARTAQPVTLTGPADHAQTAAGDGTAAGHAQTARDSGPAGPAPAATDSRPAGHGAPAVPVTGPAGTAQPPAHARPATAALPWGISVLAAGLAVEAMADRTGDTGAPAAGVLVGWALTALGLALAGPGLTHLCGRLLQAVRPGALRLLAGRGLMEEAHRLGRPLGVVCAVASAAYAAAELRGADGSSFGPLSTLGALLVSGCAVATLLTTAVEAKHTRADATSALLRLGAPATVLRGAAALRAVALLAAFGPLTLAIAELAALPLARS
ncbi:hypothetical protein ACIQR3_36060, partial [Streptomyces sp. NPDC090994]